MNAFDASGRWPALLSVLVALAGLAPRLNAQCSPTDMFCDDQPPTVTITPAGGSYTSRDVNVTIDWTDNRQLDLSTVNVRFNNVDVTPSFVTTTGTTSVRSTGVVQLVDGSNTLSATISDAKANASGATANYTYTPPPPAVPVTTPAALPSMGGVLPTREEVVRAVYQQVLEREPAPGPGEFTHYVGEIERGTTVRETVRALAKAREHHDRFIDVYSERTALTFIYRHLLAREPDPGAWGWIDHARVHGWNSVIDALVDSGEYAALFGDWLVPGRPVLAWDADRAPEVLQPTGTATVERGLCLSIGVSGGASECGDLRLAHGLPGVSVLNRGRAPTLLYNSQHAAPTPIVSVDVRVPAGTPVPEQVTAVLYLNGTPRVSGSWPGWRWQVGQARRVALSFDATQLPTGVYPYVVEVARRTGSTVTGVRQLHGELIVVNRVGSTFGTGWWLAGLEQLVELGEGRKLWVGGDGSARIYAPAGTGVWVAPNPQRADTLRTALTGTGYRRVLPGGGAVHFSAAGQHTATEDRLGRVTEFVWEGQWMRGIRLPVPGRGGSVGPYDYYYDFQYGNQAAQGSTLSAVVLSAGGGTRTTRLWQDTQGRMTRIQDPDLSSVQYGYAGEATRRVRQRWDRVRTYTYYDYGAGGQLGAVTVPAQAELAVGTRTAIRAAEAPLLNGAPTLPEEVHVQIDGPRTDVVDVTRIWTGRWGAPVRIMDAAGGETVLTRTQMRYPALVTRVDHPKREDGARRTVSAQYDGRGNVLAQTDWSTSREYNGATVYATTHYERTDPNWPDFVTRTTAPEGEQATVGYDAATGLRLWQQAGPEVGGRVEFDYHPLTHASAPGLPWRVRTQAAETRGEPGEVYTYDARGNLASVTSPTGVPSYWYKDAIGRDTLVLTAIDRPVNGQYALSRQRIVYNPAGLVERTETAAKGQALTVANTYDLEGRVLTNTRTMTPDPNGIGVMTIRWEYDALGRQVMEEDPNYMKTRTGYDAAGNATTVRTRRGHEIRMKYDALGRLTERVTPEAVTFRTQTQEYLQTWTFPRFALDVDAAADTVISADTARFAYDAVGNMLRADNRYARVRRAYATNGALIGDTLHTRTYTGQTFTSHSYGLRHRYDLNGRRVWTQYPGQLASAARSVTGDSVTYGYDTRTGALGRVRDLMGDVFTFGYNAEGQLDARTLPGGLRESVRYDAEGRRTRSDLVGNNPTFGGGQIIFSEFNYDARGKIWYGSSGAAGGASEFDGMGALIRYSANVGNQHTYEMDPLGNARSEVAPPDYEREGGSYHPYVVHGYEKRTGRLLSTLKYENVTSQHATVAESENWYDQGGNKTRHRSAWRMGNDRTMIERTYLYYGADDKLRAVDRQRCMTTVAQYIGPSSTTSMYCGTWDAGLRQDPGTFEEYRYDALGRRILVRNRPEASQCTGVASTLSACAESAVRTVWDGDQIIAEVRAGSWTDSDGDTGDRAGVVLYTHGPGIDAPLSLVRTGLASGTWSIIPHADWRGMYAAGTHPDGSIKRCGSSGCLDLDTEVDWPSGSVGAFFNETQTHQVRKWFGSLIQNQADASGQLYRRNRYYDPASGRFTQEDPIGLAGGLNLYGFGGGDPVSYSDPFGLSPCSEIRGEIESVSRDMAVRIERYLDHYSKGEADTGHMQQIEQRVNTYDRLQRRYRQEKCKDDDDHDDWSSGGGSTAAAVRNQFGSLPGPQVEKSHGWRPRLPDPDKMVPAPKPEEVSAWTIAGVVLLVLYATLVGGYGR